MNKLFIVIAAIALLAQSSFPQATENFRGEMLAHFLQNADLDSIGDADGLQNSATADSVYIALLESSPGITGDISSECTYTGYTRRGVARTGSDWTVSHDTASNAAAITFGLCTGGTNTAAHWAVIGVGDKVLFYGALAASLTINSDGDGVQPNIAIGSIKCMIKN